MANRLEWEITRNYGRLRPPERKVADVLLQGGADAVICTSTEKLDKNSKMICSQIYEIQ